MTQRSVIRIKNELIVMTTEVTNLIRTVESAAARQANPPAEIGIENVMSVAAVVGVVVKEGATAGAVAGIVDGGLSEVEIETVIDHITDGAVQVKVEIAGVIEIGI